MPASEPCTVRSCEAINLCKDQISERTRAKIAAKIYNHFQPHDDLKAKLKILSTHLKHTREFLQDAEKYHRLLLQHGAKHGTSTLAASLVRRIARGLRKTSMDAAAHADIIRKIIPSSSNAALDDWLRVVSHARSIDEGLRGTVEDLKALCREFSEVWWHAQDARLAVVTDPITLEDDNGRSHHLGPMEIQLLLREVHLRQDGGQAAGYLVRPREPNHSCDGNYFHPHVAGEVLCEGDGKVAVTQALLDRRVLDFFTIVDKILKSYSSDSPHRNLEDWAAPPCIDCRGPAYGEGSHYCIVCDEPICGDCGTHCQNCETIVCNGHSGYCNSCHESYCNECITSCECCNSSICIDENCLHICGICANHVCENCSKGCDACGSAICVKCYDKMTHVEEDDADLCPECVKDNENEQKEQEGTKETSEAPGQARQTRGERPGFTDTQTGWDDGEGRRGNNSSTDEPCKECTNDCDGCEHDRVEESGWAVNNSGNLDIAA